MYTAYIGKKLVKILNAHGGPGHTVESFFDEVFYPCFFRNARFLLDTNNAPPGQAYKQKAKTPLTDSVIEEQRLKIHAKIDAGEVDASIFLGGPSSDIGATTSGQITNLSRKISSEDVYASWIGTGLAATVEGGLSLLFDDEDTLLAIYEGWERYRSYLDMTEELKPHQINTWNGQWLAYRFSSGYNPKARPQWKLNSDNSALITETWVRLLFELSHHYRGIPDKSLLTFVYAFGQTNRTVGFVRLELSEVTYIHDLYERLFGQEDTGVPSARFAQLYKTEFGFKGACDTVSVGKRALQPKDLRTYLEGKFPSYDASDGEKRFHFHTQETWIIAMLNNDELNKRAENLATALQDFSRDKTDRGKMSNARAAEEVLSSKTRRAFIETLTAIMETDGSSGELFNQIVEEVVTMPAESVPLFLTLLRFKYAYLNRKPVKVATAAKK